MGKDCILSTGKLPPEGLPRNGVVRIPGHPVMTSDVTLRYINQSIYELHREKTGFLHMRKQIRFQIREADQCLCFRYIDSTIPLLSKYKISSL